jgi:hypothetical protein
MPSFLGGHYKIKKLKRKSGIYEMPHTEIGRYMAGHNSKLWIIFLVAMLTNMAFGI